MSDPAISDAGVNSTPDAGAPSSSPIRDAGGAAPDSGVNTPPPSGDAPASVEPSTYGSDAALDKLFGLEPESGQSDAAKPDVPPASNPPASRQSEEVAKTEAPKTGDPASDDAAGKDAAKTESQTDDPLAKIDGKLNWDSAPEHFRAAHKELQQEYLAKLNSSVESKYLSEPTEFAKWMKEASPTSYKEIGAQIATESADMHPKEWAQYILAKNPDVVAELITGKEGMTAETLRAQLAVLTDEDDPDVQKALEKEKAKTAEADAAKSKEQVETPEQKEIREWREEREAQKKAEVKAEVFSPIVAAVDDLVSQAGLEIKNSEIEGKPFESLDEETQFKVMVNALMPMWIDFRIKQNPGLLNMQSQLGKFLDAKDAVSARGLQHPTRIAITNFTNEFLSLATGFKAKSKASDTKPPSPDVPPPVVKAAGASSGSAPSDDDGPINWNVTEADLVRR